jgi:hypothetical protein
LMEEARKVSQDMEDILENGGFRFKETVMAGDPLEVGHYGTNAELY